MLELWTKQKLWQCWQPGKVLKGLNDEIKIFTIFTRKSIIPNYFFSRRGAELIEELSRKQIQKQQELEKSVLQKIKSKMDSIKAAQKRIQGQKSKENTTHAEGLSHDFDKPKNVVQCKKTQSSVDQHFLHSSWSYMVNESMLI